LKEYKKRTKFNKVNNLTGVYMLHKEYSGLEFYMSQLEKFPLLNKQEEYEVGQQATKGDESAISLLVRSNLRLVVKIAHNFKGFGVGLNDLVAEGNIGLLLAARKFDPDKGAKFSSYSALWIKQSIRNAVAKMSRNIRIPIQSLSKISKIYKAKKTLNMDLDREPTLNELANYLDLPEATISRLEKVQLSSLSLDCKSTTHQSNNELIEFVKDPQEKHHLESLYLQEDLTSLKEEFGYLRVREKQILNWRYGLDGNEPQTLEQVSGKMGISRERVRQIQKTGLKRLQKLIKRKQQV
jgi:RNA polymerase primary sigma factor